MANAVDAYKHQQVSYADALGCHRYDQAYTGTGITGNPYVVLRTVQYNRDTVGNLTSTYTFDASETLQASQRVSYDGLGRKTAMNDDDSGSGWTFTYDSNSNPVTQTDPRNQSVYMSYDLFD